MESKIGGLRKKGRLLLARLLKSAPGTISVESASKILSLDSRATAILLSSWAKRGWLSRIQRGLYIRIPLQSTSTDIVPEEPRLIAHAIFSPCYIAGFTASEHWGLTEQIFNTVVVLTQKKVHKRNPEIKGIKFLIKTISIKRFFGTKSIWIGTSKIEVSDSTKTIIDCLNDPILAGGIRMTGDFLKNYFNSKEKNPTLLLDYAKRMSNSAIYKRLGFLLEKYLPNEHELINKCRENIKFGYSQLDPSIPGKSINTRWRLWIPLKHKIQVEQ